MDRDLLETYLSEGLSLEQIGVLVNRDPSTVGYWMKEHGLVANGRDKHAPRGGLTKAQLEPLVTRVDAARDLGGAWRQRFDRSALDEEVRPPHE